MIDNRKTFKKKIKLTTVARKCLCKTSCLNVRRTVSEKVGLTASLKTHSIA